ncbi:MAG TPA: thioredoxin family protein [Azoarcus taiwanensis]|uniref:Thioredoxin family protein n=1 Tax=Azoarcus taiwanensis TaxID=666964 RepID=A0A972FCV7_9RHOO|nr:thioredoxin family protein [Azoarcus taiwanensis]NMG04409.1 thioredoxin family protein [Azoarcus taiwanensis]HRQ57178.1 thioredoxin family protein [Azoarcus taiwanensis]
MKVKIYGSGCAKCQQLATNAETAARRLGITLEVEKVTDMNAIIDAGVMRTPALGIGDEVLVEGKVASSEELMQMLGR